MQQTIYISEGAVSNLIDDFFAASKGKLNVMECEGIIKRTDRLVLALKTLQSDGCINEISDLSYHIFREFQKHNLCELQLLAKWGATVENYSSLHSLFQIVKKCIKNDEIFEPKNDFPSYSPGSIVPYFPQYKTGDELFPHDITKIIIQQDLKALKKMLFISKNYHEMTKSEIIYHFNEKNANLSDFKIASKKDFADFVAYLGDNAHKITKLALPIELICSYKTRDDKLIESPKLGNEIVRCFPNIQHLSFQQKDDMKSLYGKNLICLKELLLLESLDFSRCHLICSHFFEFIPQLKKLNVNNCYIAGDMKPLKFLINLIELDASNSGLSNSKFLKSMPKLKNLNLSNNPALKNSKGLSTLENLENLDLSGCTGFSDIDIKASHLTNLSLKRTGLKDSITIASMPNLIKLDLSECEITDLEILTPLLKLTDLNLSWCKIKNIKFLESMVNIKKIDISGNLKIRDLKPCLELSKLKRLNIKRCVWIKNLHGLDSLKGLWLIKD